MAHFRCPSSSIAGTARYSYSSGDTIQHNDLSPTQLHYTETASESRDNNYYSSDEESASSSSSSTILASRTSQRQNIPSTSSSSVSANFFSQQPLNKSNEPSTSRSNCGSISNNKASTSSSATQHSSSNNNDNEEGRRCWICFGEDEDSEGNWVNPCPCSLVAHEKCLLDWITENQKGSPLKTVHCPQCSAEYHLIERSNWTLSLFGVIDEIVHTAAPYVSALGFGLSLLVVSTTYGAFSVLLLFGTKEGERVLGPPPYWTWRAWVGLPCIPLTLLSSRSRWADSTLPFAAFLFLRASTVTNNGNNNSIFSLSLASSPLSVFTNHQQNALSLIPHFQFSWPPSPLATLGLLPWVRLFYNNMYSAAQYCISRQLKLKIIDRRQQQNRNNNTNNNSNQVIISNNNNNNNNSNNNDTSRNNVELERNPELDILLDRGRPTSLGMIFMGTLMWPVISNITGSFLGQFNWFQKHFPEQFHRNIIGGCFFVVIKDIGNLIYRYQKVRQYRSRRLLNYNELKRK